MKNILKKIRICLTCVVMFLSISLLKAEDFFTMQEYTDEEIQIMKQELLQKPLNGYIGLSFTNMVPQNEFMDNLKRTGQGFSVWGGYHFDPIPIATGIQLDFIFNGSEEIVFRIFDDTLSSQSMIIPINLFFRMQPEVLGFLSPYLDIYAGMNLFSYSVSYTKEDEYFEQPDYLTLSWNWGLGIGTMLKLGDFFSYPYKRTSMYFDMRFRYLRGNNTKYFTGRVEGATLKIQEFESNTNMVLFHAGFTVRF